MGFDLQSFQTNLARFQKQNEEGMKHQKVFDVLNLITKETSVSQINFADLDVRTLEEIESYISSLMDTYDQKQYRVSETLFNPVHEYRSRGEMFRTLRTAPFRQYPEQDDFI